MQVNSAVAGGYYEMGVARQTLSVDKIGQATNPVATMLNFTTIGIENTAVKVHIWLLGSFNQYQLVKANAQVPIGQLANFGRSQ